MNEVMRHCAIYPLFITNSLIELLVYKPPFAMKIHYNAALQDFSMIDWNYFQNALKWKA